MKRWDDEATHPITHFQKGIFIICFLADFDSWEREGFEKSGQVQPFRIGDFIGVTLDGFISNLNVNVYVDSSNLPMLKSHYKRDHTLNNYNQMAESLFGDRKFLVKNPEENMIFCRVVALLKDFITVNNFLLSKPILLRNGSYQRI